MRRGAFRNIRAVGVEGGSFQKGVTRRTTLAAVLTIRSQVVNVGVEKITVDGLDATKKLSQVLKRWKFDVVLLAGASFAGFNIVDPTAIYREFRKPVIVITPTKPDNRAVTQALQKHFKDWQTRWAVFEKLGSVCDVTALAGKHPVHIEPIGAEANWASDVVRALSLRGRVPAPLRVARLIARGLS